jgi:hypothetical protein
MYEIPQAGKTYRVFFEGKEVEHFHVTRVHGRRIELAVTAYSALCWQTTRLKWRKMVERLYSAGASMTEEDSDACALSHAVHA